MDSVVDSVVSHRDGVSDDRVVLLPAGLGVQGQGDLLTARLSDDDLLLLNGVGGINELGHIEALVVNLVLTLDLSDGDVLDDADLLGSGVGQAAGHLQRDGDQGDLVGLGLVLLVALLELSVSVCGSLVSVSVGRGLHSAGGHLHGLRVLLVGDLGGGAGSGDILPLVHVGADLSLDHGVGLLADGENPVKAVVGVSNLLDCQSDGSHLLRKGWDADLGVDGGVGVPAEQLGGVAVAVSGGEGRGSGAGHQEGEEEGLEGDGDNNYKGGRGGRTGRRW